MKNCEGKRRAAGGEDKARAGDCTQHQLIKLDMWTGSLQISLKCYKKIKLQWRQLFREFSTNHEKKTLLITQWAYLQVVQESLDLMLKLG